MTDDADPWDDDGSLTFTVHRPTCACDVPYCAHMHSALSLIAYLLGARPGSDLVIDQTAWPVEYM